IERLALALAMAPGVKPDTLDIFFGLNSLIDRPFTEFGGVSDKAFSGFIPTGQTLNFLISANDPDWRIYSHALFSNKHRLMAEQVTQLLPVDDGVPKWAGIYRLNEEWLHYFTTG
ncbi:ATP-binding protein, partial [Raoultella ornithinolytica]